MLSSLDFTLCILEVKSIGEGKLLGKKEISLPFMDNPFFFLLFSMWMQSVNCRLYFFQVITLYCISLLNLNMIIEGMKPSG
jgi:hypothetical protein